MKNLLIYLKISKLAILLHKGLKMFGRLCSATFLNSFDFHSHLHFSM